MVMAELSMVPVGAGESLSPFVAEMLKLIAASGIDYRLTPMGTLIEGEYDAVMAVVGACFHRATELADRVTVQLKLDWRRGPESRFDSKVATVEQAAGQTFAKL